MNSERGTADLEEKCLKGNLNWGGRVGRLT